GHRNNAPFVRDIAEFRLDRIPRTALAIDILLERILRIGISALNHETGNDAVKNCSVVKSGLRQLDNILHMPWRDIRIELDFDIAEFRLDDRPRPLRRFNLWRLCCLSGTNRPDT